MIRNCLVVFVVAALAAAAWAQEASYVGQITGDRVYVRCGPTVNHPEVTHLSAPAQVTVLGQEGDYLKIVPPAGIYSLIAKQYVTAAGTAGTVTGDNVAVRAGSDLSMKAMETVQARVNRGDKVTIVGESEAFYKIAPLPGVTMYVAARYVQRAGAGGATASPAITTTQPVGEPTTAPAVALTTMPAVMPPPAAPATDARTADLLKEYEACKAALEAEYAKPIEQRDLARVLAMYKAIDVPADHPLKAYIDWRVKSLEQVLETMLGAQEAHAKIAAAEAEQNRLAAERSRIQAEVKLAEAEVGATATGRLFASKIYDGGGGLPRRWMVRDDQSGAILLFAENAGAADLASLEGYLVKLHGRRRLPPGQKLFVMDVDRAEKLPGERKSEPAAILEIRDIQPPRPAPQPTPAPPEPVAPPAPPAPPAPRTEVPSDHINISFVVPQKIASKAELLKAVLGTNEFDASLRPLGDELNYSKLEAGQSVQFLVPRQQVTAVAAAAAAERARKEAPTRPAPAGSVSEPRYYVVQAGDSGIWGIAEKMYGNGRYWNLIAEANRDVNPAALKVGTRLLIPPLPATTAPATAPANSSATAPAVSTPRPTVNANEYN